MAITSEILDFFIDSLTDVFDRIDGLHMLELGDQLMDAPVSEHTAKEYFTNRGVLHTSLDLNGQNGALPVDLSKPTEDSSLIGKFNVITNSGTLEHVEPLSAQYIAFTNVHRWLRSYGMVLHVIPDIGSLERDGANLGHCNNYYCRDFFEVFVSSGCYKLISCEVSTTGNWHVCLQKLGDCPFSLPVTELSRHITRKSGGVVYPGINDVG